MQSPLNTLLLSGYINKNTYSYDQLLKVIDYYAFKEKHDLSINDVNLCACLLFMKRNKPILKRKKNQSKSSMVLRKKIRRKNVSYI